MATAIAVPFAGHAEEPEAEETEAPDLEFLEFIGSWEGDDENWLEIVEMAEIDVERQLTAGTDKGAEDTADEN